MSEQSKIDAERAALQARIAELEAGQDSLRLVRDEYKRKADEYRGKWAALLARASLPVGVPDGYAMVPVEPTPEMQAAALRHVVRQHTLRDVWKDMCAAAPTVKAEQVDCLYCQGHGEVTRTSGQTAESYSEHNEECPECQGTGLAPSLPAAGSAVEEVEVVAYLHERSGAVATADNVRVMEEGSVSSGYTEPLMTVAQHNRIVAALRAQIAERDAAIEEWSGTAVQNGMEVDRLTAVISAQQSDGVDFGFDDRSVRVSQEAYAIFLDREQQLRDDIAALEGQLAAQQSAPERVSVPVELADRIVTHLEWDGDESQTVVQYANKCDALAAELRALLSGAREGGV